MASIPKDLEINLSEDLSRLIKGVELQKEMEVLIRAFRIDECRDYCVPKRYNTNYGIDRGSLLSCVLESYHQLRLKDDD